jgi:hypothetical protein
MSLDSEFKSEVSSAIDVLISESPGGQTRESNAAATADLDADSVGQQLNEEHNSNANENQEITPEETAEVESQEAKEKTGEEPREDDGGADGPNPDTEQRDDGSRNQGDDSSGPKEAEQVARPSSAVLEQAVRAGIPLDDASLMPESALQNVIASVEREVLAAKERAQSEIASQKKEEEQKEPNPLDNLPKLDPEVYDEDVIRAFDQVSEVIKSQSKQIEDLKVASEKASSHGQDEALREAGRWFDDRVASLGEDFHDSLGKGTWSSLSQGSSQAANREKIAEQIDVMASGYTATGRTVPPRDELFSKAARFVLQGEFDRVREQRLSDAMTKRSATHLHRPGSSNVTKNMTPAEEAAAAVNAQFFGKT